MKILITAASFASNMSGLQRHALNLVRCLLPESDITALHLVIAPWQLNFVRAAAIPQDARLEVHVAEINRTSLSRNLWYHRSLPGLATQLQADVVHLSYPMPMNAPAFSCPTMVTLHDLYPYEIPMNFGFPKFIFNRVVLQQCLRNVDAVACVSDITLLRLKQYTSPRVWKKALRIYNCVETGSVRGMKPPVSELQNQRFLLSVAQHRLNKNIPLLIRAFARILRTGQVSPDMKLVVIGITGPETLKIRRLVSILGLAERVRFLEGVSDSELQWCYTHCEAVVCPSITEGFGLPVAEALLAGCRIVCSDIPAFREVGDEECRFVALKKDAEEALAAAIVAVLSEPKRTPKSLHQFSASVLAKQYLGLYRKLISSGKPLENARVAAPICVAASERQPL